MRSDTAPGGTVPDYELPDHENLPRKLSEIQGYDPLILALACGHYCPEEHQQHLELAANYPKIAVAYAKIQKDLDIQEYTDPEHNPNNGGKHERHRRGDGLGPLHRFR